MTEVVVAMRSSLLICRTTDQVRSIGLAEAAVLRALPTTIGQKSLARMLTDVNTLKTGTNAGRVIPKKISNAALSAANQRKLNIGQIAEL